MKKIFIPEDFISFGNSTRVMIHISPHEIANICNKRINALIENWPSVYSDDQKMPWHNIDFQGSKYVAHLAFIEELHKEPCKHEPVTELKEFIKSQLISPGKIGWTYWNDQEWFCGKCGVKLEAKWGEIK